MLWAVIVVYSPWAPKSPSCASAQDFVTCHYPGPDESIALLPFLIVFHTTRSLTPCLHLNTVYCVYCSATHKTCYMHDCKFPVVVALKFQCRENGMLCMTFTVGFLLCCVMKRLPSTTVFNYYY